MFIEPMYAKSTTRESLANTSTDKGWGEYVADVKFDGVRATIVHDDDGINIYSRVGNLQNGKLPQLEEELTKVLPYGSKIDGELAYVEGSVDVVGQNVPLVSFNQSMRILGSLPEKARAKQEVLGHEVSFILFDVLEWTGESLVEETQTRRLEKIREELGSLRSDPTSKIWLGNLYEDPETFTDVYDELVKLNVEGLILKHKDGVYVPGKRPNKTWYKVKTTKTADVVVMGYTEGNGKYEGMIGAVEFGAYQDGELVRVARCSGLTYAERQDITDNQEEYLGRVFEVKFNDLVGSGEYRTPRHPNFLHFRTDKSSDQCLREQFK